MKAIALILCFCFSFNVLASTGTIQELERVFDDYSYTMTVDWDQKDQTFFQNQTRTLVEKINTMMKEDGLTREDILAMAEKKMANKKQFEALKLQLSIAAKAETTEDLIRLLQDNTENFYSRGASWNGETLYYIGAALAVGAFVALFIWGATKEPTTQCVEWTQVQQCGWYTPAQNIPAIWQCWYQPYCTVSEPIQN